MSRNLAACTLPGGSYPGFISINEDEDGVEVIVRSPARPDGTCGDLARILLPVAVFEALMARAIVRRG